MKHQFVTARGEVLDERLFGDRIVRFLFSRARERAPALLRMVTGARMSALLGLLNFDLPLSPRLLGNRRFLRSCGVDLGECLEAPESLKTPRQIFERQIRYWETRPLPAHAPELVVSPADSRVVVGSLEESSALFLKGKFFDLDELVGEIWAHRFDRGEFAVFRLTPEKYHYNHVPVSGQVVDHFVLEGRFLPCNPGAVVELVTPYSKNRREITVIDTDLPGGTGVGLVAMVEVVALMIGHIDQRYSAHRYDDPQPMTVGMWVQRGQPKSLFRPGSSTDVLLFEPGRIHFAPELVENQRKSDVESRFTLGFGQSLAETEIAVRSAFARRQQGPSSSRSKETWLYGLG